jgi:cell division inhibitor SepF
MTDRMGGIKMTDIFNKLFNRLGSFRDEIDYEDDYEQEEYNESETADVPEEPKAGPFRRQQPGKVVDLRASSGQQQVVILQPADIETAQQACDHIRAGKTVICNIEKVDPKVAQRVIDFITGAAYALDGKVMPVSSVIFVVAPRQTTLVEGNIVSQSMEYIRQTAVR